MAEESSDQTASAVANSVADAPVERDEQHVDTPSPNKTMTEEELAAISGGVADYYDYYDDSAPADILSSDWTVSGGDDPSDPFSIS